MPHLSRIRLAGLAAGAVALSWAGAAGATSVLFDDFDGETAALNYNAFANWTVSDGTVDVVNHGSFGINCAGGAGKCVDLDGSTGNAGIMTSNPFAFDAGDIVTLTFQARGNDRGGALDTLTAGFSFLGATDGTSFSGGGFGAGGGAFLGATTLSFSDTLASEDPYAAYTLGFTAASAGSLNVFINAAGGDNVGPILDNVGLDITAPNGVIPEPATWAMMVLGFGGLGAMLRRRRAPVYA